MAVEAEREKKTRSRGSRRTRESRSGNSAIQSRLPSKRAFKPVELLSDEAVEQVHCYSLELLRDVGLEFDLPEAWGILKRNGATVDSDTGMVKFDPETVEHWVAQAPSTFNLSARNPARNLDIGGDNIAYGSAGSTPNVLDMDEGRRPGNSRDFVNLVKLSHTLDTVNFFSGYPVEPTDRSANSRHLDCNYDLLTLSDRVIRLYGIGKTRIDDGLDMISIAHGISRDELKDSPRALTVLNVNSPLKVDSRLLQGAMEMARNGQAVVVTPVAFAGAMSPITLSGSLIQHNAECLGVIALLQMMNPGAPVFYGSIISNVDMKSGAPALGTPETVTGTVASGQMARRYKLPTRLFSACSSNAVDAQSAYETLFSLWACYLGGVNMVFHAHGYMETGLITSFEKVLLDSDLIGMMNALSRPIDLSDSDEALAAIKEVGPGGHFLSASHTMSRYKTAFHTPLLSDWRAYEYWLKDGGKDYSQRASAKWKQLLDEYQKPDTDPAVDQALCEFVECRKREIGRNEI